jgi:hypothetical protein
MLSLTAFRKATFRVATFCITKCSIKVFCISVILLNVKSPSFLNGHPEMLPNVIQQNDTNAKCLMLHFVMPRVIITKGVMQNVTFLNAVRLSIIFILMSLAYFSQERQCDENKRFITSTSELTKSSSTVILISMITPSICRPAIYW